jgi:hypothetical protein
MRFTASESSAWSAHHCSAHFVSRVPAEPGNVLSSQLACAAAGGGEGFPVPQKDRHKRTGWGSKCSQKEGVDTFHTLGFGFGCTGLGAGRIGEDFGREADSQGERLVRVPPRARVFPVQGLFSL